MRYTNKLPENSPIILPVWLNVGVFVFKLGGCGFARFGTPIFFTHLGLMVFQVKNWPDCIISQQ